MAALPLPERIKLQLPSFRDADSVELIVGKEKARFIVHKDLLCSTASFFDRTFNSSFKEAEQQRVELPEDPPSAVHCFVLWVYFRSYSLPKSQDDTFELLIRL